MSLFTNSQIKRLSNIFDNAGQVTLGSLVLSPLLGSSDANALGAIILLGSILTISLWWIALRFERISI